MVGNPLEAFLPATRAWFEQRFGQPTRAQVLGWPPIQRGEHTLILAPTGSGKTLAAFLWGIDRICSSLASQPANSRVQLLYISPLKALDNDIARNLEEPLLGIRRQARELGAPVPEVRTAVRTGDTPQAVRQRMLRQPPHILITTPESLFLLLTSPQARTLLASVQSVIVDEVHTLCGNKRGVHLGLSLERLEMLCGQRIQRIALSATQRPLEEVARYIGGQTWQVDDAGDRVLMPRPVTVVDAGAAKPMDLQVITPVPDLRRLPGGSVWPSLVPCVLDEIRRHDTTLVFTNSRRAAERLADRLNEQYALESEEEIAPGSVEGLLVDGVPKGQGWMGTGRVGGPFRAHHGSVSREIRLGLEQALKSGRLPALIATSSLELGIDIGSVDAVLQVQSPHGIARGLQRVGRAGHMVGETSYGRIYATHREDLMDAAAVAHGMLDGDIEPTYTPQNCLDVLAQQIVAMVAVEPVRVDEVYDVVRQAHGYGQLSRGALLAVLKMISGGYDSSGYSGLRASVEWDRVNDRLLPLPGTRLLAIRNGGTIPDRGEFHVVLPDGHTNLGTLDEEFVFETHVGDVFVLGNNTWRVMDIDEDRLVVADAAGSTPRMPFWHGELPKRDYHMGLRLGAFRRQLAERVAQLEWAPEDPAGDWPQEATSIFDWLARDYAMDEASCRNAVAYVWQQLASVGAISSDRTVVVESFTDALGDQRMVIHSCFGARINSVWAIALTHALRERTGTTAEVQVSDDAILFRLPEGDRGWPVNVVTAMMPEEARERVLLELPNSALFGAQFRMNAARALVLPRVRGAGRRTPFWLQRLRARDLLAIARGWDDFPLVAETYRDCLRDVLDLEHFTEMLQRLVDGEIQVHAVETVVPSPVAAGLLFQFAAAYLYESDAPKLERQIQALSINRELLADLLDDGSLAELLRPEVIERVECELQHRAPGYQARTVDELALILRQLGDLTTAEIAEGCQGNGPAWIEQLEREGRAMQIQLPARGERWIAAEHAARYRAAFGASGVGLGSPGEAQEPSDDERENAALAVLRHLLRVHGPLTMDAIFARYPWDPVWLEQSLDSLVSQGAVLRGALVPGLGSVQWCDRLVLERLHRETLTLLRHEVQPVILPEYATFLARWQGLAEGEPPQDRSLQAALARLAGLALPAEIWERDVLPLRVPGYSSAILDELCTRGELMWQAEGSDAQHARVRFFWAGEGNLYLQGLDPGALEALSSESKQAYDLLRKEGPLSAEALSEVLQQSPATCTQALLQLLLAGLVTCDRFDVVRAMVAGDLGRAAPESLQSSLDEALAEWRDARRPSTLYRPRQAELAAAKRRVQRRMATSSPMDGHWSVLHRYGVLGATLGETERGLAQARQALQCFGILSREVVDGQRGMPPWGALYPYLHRMELAGQVRRGYFVQGLGGLQYALPDALDELRQPNRGKVDRPQALVLLNAADPALIEGIHLQSRRESDAAAGPSDVPGFGFSRIPSTYVVLSNGEAVLVYEHGGGRWQSLPGLAPSVLENAIRMLLRHLTEPGGLCHRPMRVPVATWNGCSPLATEHEALLTDLGFRRDTPGMVWDGLGAPGNR